MTINDTIPNCKEPQRRNQRHGRSRKPPVHSSVQAQPASDVQSGSAETAPSALFNSALISGGQFTAAANANHRNVTININATEGVTPQPQIQNRPSRQTTNRSRKKRTDLTPDPPGPVQRSNEIYERHLRLKKRGHPLWIPQSNMVLPIPYRAQGVRVGDVGIFTENGGFDFLFNICVRREDPINPRELPDNFIPISPPVNPTDIRKFAEFSPGSYLASSSVAESRTAESSGLIFESSASEGAILTMPEGAYSEDLSNFSRFRQYIATHAEDWYKFVNGPRGREAQNGDLHVVVGCDKTTSWGMATFADSSLSQETNFRLKFSALGEQQSQRNAGNKYMWEHSGVAEVRVGPGRGENEELGETDSNRLRNQSIFLRTLNVTLSEKVWEEIFPHLIAVADRNPHSGIQDHPKCRPHVINTGHSHPEPSQSNSSHNLPSRRHNSTNCPISSNSTENYGILNDLVSALVSPNLISPFGNLYSRDVDGVPCLSSTSLHEEMEESLDSGPSTDCPKEGSSGQISSNTSPSLGRYVEMQCDSTSIPDVILTRSSTCNNVLHPSKIINQYLLKHVPQARVAVTHDKDWSSIIDEVSCHSDPSQLFSVVCSMNDIVLDNDTGLVYLELKETNEIGLGVQSEKAKVSGLIESIKNGRLRLDQYLFGFHDDRCLRLEDLCNMLRSGSTNQPIPMDSFLSTHPERPFSLDEILNNFEGDPHVQIHRRSITSLRAKLSLLPTRHVDRSSSLLRLGDALLRRFSQWTQKDDLEEAIWSYKETLSLIPNSHYYYLEALLGLCSSLYQRYHLLGHADDLKNLLSYLDLQIDILNRQRSLLAPVEVQLCPPSRILDVTSIAQSSAFQFAPGTYDSGFYPALGQASLPYAYPVPSSYLLSQSSLPDPGLLFILLKPDKFVPHPGALSPAFADMVIHSILNNSQLDWGGVIINDASSYLNFSVLHGSNNPQVDLFRKKDGSGKLWDDVFADGRLLFMPRTGCALLILMNRKLNSIAQPILNINETLNLISLPLMNEIRKQKQYHGIFHHARFGNCSYSVYIILVDYVGAISNLVPNASGPLMAVGSERPFAPVHQGSNLLHWWHSILSAPDALDTVSTTKTSQSVFESNDLAEITAARIVAAVHSHMVLTRDAREWTSNRLERDPDDRTEDGDIANFLHNSTEACAGKTTNSRSPYIQDSFNARGVRMENCGNNVPQVTYHPPRIIGNEKFIHSQSHAVSNGPQNATRPPTAPTEIAKSNPNNVHQLETNAAGEALKPYKSVPRATRATFYRIVLFTILTIELCINQIYSSLLNFNNKNADGSASPVTVVFRRAGFELATQVVNAVLLTALLSVTNSSYYASSRMLLAMAKSGQAPRIFGLVNKRGISVPALLVSLAFSCLTFLTYIWSQNAVFFMLIKIIGLSALVTWTSICVISIRIRQAYKAQGLSLSNLPYQQPFYPWLPIGVIVFGIVKIIASAYSSVIQSPFDFRNVLATYINIALYIILFCGYMIYKRVFDGKTKHPYLRLTFGPMPYGDLEKERGYVHKIWRNRRRESLQ